MTNALETVATKRAELIKAALARHRLVFVQLGSGFDGIFPLLLEKIPAVHAEVERVIDLPIPSEGTTILISCMERLDARDPRNPPGLGKLRESVLRLLDASCEVCLVSRSPRSAYGSTPGSSLLEDASMIIVDVLDADETELLGTPGPLNWLPAAHVDHGHPDLLNAILMDLGSGVISALDHCLFEIDPRSSDGLQFLTHREIEALRGAGLVEATVDGSVQLRDPRLLPDLKRAVSDLISLTTTAPPELQSVTGGLWYIERTLRKALRSAAISEAGSRWRGTIVGGGLASEVLRRAQSDSCPSAVSIAELRDPLEWLTLGELLDIIRSSRFQGLGLGPHLWRKFADQLVPVRNSLSHMRTVKPKDEETVRVWVGIVKQKYGH